MTQAQALVIAVRAIAEAIQSLGQIPSGHLYAQVMGKMNLENYQYIIDILKQAGRVTEDSSHMLKWVA